MTAKPKKNKLNPAKNPSSYRKLRLLATTQFKKIVWLFSGLILGVLIWFSLTSISQPDIFPIKQILLVSENQHVSLDDLNDSPIISQGNFFTANLNDFRQYYENHPWARKVSVRRVWPDTIEVSIEEHIPTAHWKTLGQTNKKIALTNQHGELFFPNQFKQEGLPFFSGPEDSSNLVFQTFNTFSKILAPTGLTIQRIELSKRSAWQLELNNGMIIRLGQNELGSTTAPERLAKFVKHMPSTIKIAVADLRYPSGFTIRAPKENSQ